MVVGASWLSSTNITFFPKPLTTFLSWLCRGERRQYPMKKVCHNQDWTHNHYVMSLTHSPLSHWGKMMFKSGVKHHLINQSAQNHIIQEIMSSKTASKLKNFGNLKLWWGGKNNKNHLHVLKKHVLEKPCARKTMC